MTISMIRGYAPPPAEGGVNYQGVAFSEYGYTYLTQEGEGESEPADGSFRPIPRMDGFGCACQRLMAYGACDPSVQSCPPTMGSTLAKTAVGLGVLLFLFMGSSKLGGGSRPYGRVSKRRKARR